MDNEPTNNVTDKTMIGRKANQKKQKTGEETAIPRAGQLFDEDDIMNSSDESDTHVRKSRGTTTMPTIIRDRSKSLRLVLDYDEDGDVIGPNGSTYNSYLGVLARTMIPIIYKDWIKVPSQLKDKVWICVQEAFFVDSRCRKKAISTIGIDWRSFKKNLTAYIYKFISDPDLISHPPEKYRHIIEEEHWTSFLNDRLTEEFQEQRKKKQKSSSLNIYPHRLSRKGYKGIKQELKETGEVENIDRSLLWKKARQNKKGEYDNEEIIN